MSMYRREGAKQTKTQKKRATSNLPSQFAQCTGKRNALEAKKWTEGTIQNVIGVEARSFFALGIKILLIIFFCLVKQQHKKGKRYQRTKDKAKTKKTKWKMNTLWMS